MGGAVRPRVLAVAVAATAGLVALGVIASVAVWGFRNGADESWSGVQGWLLLLWVSVAVAVAMVVGVALAAVRALRRPLVDLSRAANELQTERLPAALRAIEAGALPAPRPGISAPAELESVAGALENLERFVNYHAERAQRADRDLGALMSGAADRAGARARLAEGIDLAPPESFASALQRDADALRALVPESPAAPVATSQPAAGLGPSISSVVAAAVHTTMRPAAVSVGELETAIVDTGVSNAVMVVLGEVLDAAIGPQDTAVVHGSVQPEGYHFAIDSPIAQRASELTYLADALRDRETARLPFGLRAAVQAAQRARLLVWLTISAVGAQWHVLVAPDGFVSVPAAAVPIAQVAPPEPEPEPEPQPEAIDTTEPVVTETVAAAPTLAGAVNGTAPRPDPVRLATARRLGEALADLLRRLDEALDARTAGVELDDEERTALLVDGTGLVGQLQETKLCSSRAQRALLRAIDVAVGADSSLPLTGSARDRVILPYEALTEIRERIAEAAGVLPTR